MQVDSEKKEMTERRPLAKNMWYEWYDWLISHIPESVKNSARNVKLEIMKLFPAKIDNNKLKKTAGAFDDN